MVLAMVGAVAVGLKSAQTFSGTAADVTQPVQDGTEQSQPDGLQPAPAQDSLLIAPQNTAPAGRELLVKTILSVVLVGGLGAAAIYGSRKLLPKITNRPGKEIRVIETTHLGPRKQLHLIEACGRRVLIASTGENVTMLADVTEISAFPANLAQGN